MNMGIERSVEQKSAARPAGVLARLRWMTSLAPLWTLLVMVLFFSLASDSFLTRSNINNLLVQISTNGILATGMTFVLLTGQIDLSIAALMALTGMISTQLFVDHGVGEPVPMLAALGIGLIFGFTNGVVSTRFRIPTFMVTLATALIAEGLTLWSSQGHTYFEIAPVADFLGSTWIGGRGEGVRLMIFISALTLLVGYLILRYTLFGRYIYMTGANPSAARLAGVNTNWIIIVAMTISGFTTALAGLANTGRLGTALNNPENSFLIDAIAVVVLGGTSLLGGRGGIAQTVIGLLIYGTLRNGLDNIPTIDPLTKDFITGVVLMVALITNVVFAGRGERDRL
jgi:ribose transport system permease protein